MSDFRTYITETGFGLERTAKLTNGYVPITKLIVGSGVLPDGSSPTEQDSLIVHEREYAVTIEADLADSNVWIARAEIPAEDGGFFIREAGLSTDANDLYCYSRLPGDYKPLLTEGAGKSYTIRLKFIPGNSSTLEIKIDPSVQFSTPADLAVVEGKIVPREQRENAACINATALIHNMRRTLVNLKRAFTS
jgi:phage-related tail fiber protein